MANKDDMATVLKPKTQTKTEKPPLYKILLLNLQYFYFIRYIAFFIFIKYSKYLRIVNIIIVCINVFNIFYYRLNCI